jgi:transposase
LADPEARIAALEAENARLRELVAQLTTRVQELEARLGRDSSNSSQPPSADPPQARPRPAPRPTGRRRGGQPGHPGHHRTPVPVEQVDCTVEHWPPTCQHCQAALAPDPAQTVGDPVRHQVVEIPPLHAEVTDHYRQRLCCPHCRGVTLAALPPTVPAGAFGPRLQAIVAVLSSRYRLSRREVAAVCADLLGVDLAVGSIAALCQATSAALAEPVAGLEAAVRQAAVAHADETEWRLAGQRRWLWVAVTVAATVFTVAASRGSRVIKGLLGATFGGILVSDRWSAYTWTPAHRRQVCWAHLKRDFTKLVDWDGAACPVGEAALALLDQVFTLWHQARDDPALRATLPARMAPLQAAFRTLLDEGSRGPSAKAAGLCAALLKLWPALWTFVTVPGVEPTNNAAEQAVRPAVLWRKGCFGSQSEDGAVFVARLLSVAATCRQQQRSLLDYLTAVCAAAQQGHPIPSLLPETPVAQAT